MTTKQVRLLYQSMLIGVQELCAYCDAFAPLTFCTGLHKGTAIWNSIFSAMTNVSGLLISYSSSTKVEAPPDPKAPTTAADGTASVALCWWLRLAKFWPPKSPLVTWDAGAGKRQSLLNVKNSGFDKSDLNLGFAWAKITSSWLISWIPRNETPQLMPEL